MVRKTDPGWTVGQFQQQRLDQLVQVVHLLELAPRILVQNTVAGEDVQLLEQLHSLPGTNFCQRGRLGRCAFHRPRPETALHRVAPLHDLAPRGVPSWGRVSVGPTPNATHPAIPKAFRVRMFCS